jgi:hypothetical protein
MTRCSLASNRSQYYRNDSGIYRLDQRDLVRTSSSRPWSGRQVSERVRMWKEVTGKRRYGRSKVAYL